MRNKSPIFFASFVVIISILCNSSSAIEVDDSICLPIVMYHQVKNYNLGKDVISSAEFESDLKYLSENQYTPINMNDLIEYFYNGHALPSKPIILSFDDGYLNNYNYVMPLIKKYNMKIVLSLIVKNTDDFTHIPDDNINYSHVTWEQLNEMLATGLVEVQNHTYNLHSNKYGRYGCKILQGESFENYREVILSDIEKAQEEILMMTGKTPTTFTYPYGSYCDEIDFILKKIGFKATLTCRYGINYISREETTDLFRLKRVCRSHNYNIKDLVNNAIESRL